MKLYEYGRQSLVFVNGTQYTLEGQVGYQNSPWERVPPTKIYFAEVIHGEITAADQIDFNSKFEARITKAQSQSMELYQKIERFVMLQNLDKLLNSVTNATHKNFDDLIHRPLDYSHVRKNENH